MAKKKTKSIELNVNLRRKRQHQAIVSFVIIFGILCVYFGLLAGTTMHAYKDGNFISACLTTAKDIAKDTSLLWKITFSKDTLIAELWCVGLWALISAFMWVDDVKKRKDFGEGTASKGSARLNDDYKGFNRDFSEEDKLKTTYLSRNVALSMNTRKTLRNNNVLIIGGSGAGKTRFFVKPNILQLNCNMVITDPSGELIESTGTFLEEEGYTLKVFNLVEMNKSNCYNPFHYIRDDQGVIMMINCLIKNTTPPESHSGDPFWEKSETALLQALCFYLKEHRPVEEQNFATVMELLRWAEVDEKNPDHESKLDRIFLKSKQKPKRPSALIPGVTIGNPAADDEEFNKYMAKTTYKDTKGAIHANDEFKSLEELDTQGTDIAVKQYKIFKMGAGKTAKSILISCAVRLTVFNLPQVAQLTRVDDIHLEDLGGTNPNQKKQALFVIIPAADSTFNFLVSMMYSQLFETLYFVAETSPACDKKRLPMHVKFLLDEFANIGTIPEFTKKLATMRKYEISCSVILQNLAQIKTMYKDDWESIVGNCDAMVFLGGKEYTTLEYISKQMGFQTIRVKTRGESHGKSGSSSQNYQDDKRELMTPDELGNMDNAKCVVQIRGLNPFLDYKFDYTQHTNYPRTSDADPDLSYVNNLNNMLRAGIDIEQEASDLIDSQAQAMCRVVTLEELIESNPNWSGYPTIFNSFQAIPDAEEEEKEFNQCILAVEQNPPLPVTETTDETLPKHEVAPSPIAEIIKEHKENGTSPYEALQKQYKTNGFFDNEEDE